MAFFFKDKEAYSPEVPENLSLWLIGPNGPQPASSRPIHW